MSKLLARAKVKLENAENDYLKMGDEDAYRDDCCYNLQQAIEMSLKSIVELNGLTIAENHDLRVNINVLNRAGVDIPMQEEIRKMASTLYSWETETRYKDGFVSLTEDIEDARLIAKELIKYADTFTELIENEVMDDIPENKLKK